MNAVELFVVRENGEVVGLGLTSAEAYRTAAETSDAAGCVWESPELECVTDPDEAARIVRDYTTKADHDLRAEILGYVTGRDDGLAQDLVHFETRREVLEADWRSFAGESMDSIRMAEWSERIGLFGLSYHSDTYDRAIAAYARGLVAGVSAPQSERSGRAPSGRVQS